MSVQVCSTQELIQLDLLFVFVVVVVVVVVVVAAATIVYDCNNHYCYHHHHHHHHHHHDVVSQFLIAFHIPISNCIPYDNSQLHFVYIVKKVNVDVNVDTTVNVENLHHSN